MVTTMTGEPSEAVAQPITTARADKASSSLVGEWAHVSKRWDGHRLSQKLLRLRSIYKWTRKVAAQVAGIPESALRNYELMKSAPKEEHLEGLANAYGIRAEALHYYDFGDVDLVAQAFFQFAATYGLEPVANERCFALRPTSSFMKSFLKKWAARCAQLENDSDRDEWRSGCSVTRPDRAVGTPRLSVFGCPPAG